MTANDQVALDATTKDTIRIAMLAQDLGNGWVVRGEKGVAIFLVSDEPDDLAVMLASSKLEKEVGEPTEIKSVNTLSPAEQAAMKKMAMRF